MNAKMAIPIVLARIIGKLTSLTTSSASEKGRAIRSANPMCKDSMRKANNTAPGMPINSPFRHLYMRPPAKPAITVDRAQGTAVNPPMKYR